MTLRYYLSSDPHDKLAVRYWNRIVKEAINKQQPMGEANDGDPWARAVDNRDVFGAKQLLRMALKQGIDYKVIWEPDCYVPFGKVETPSYYVKLAYGDVEKEGLNQEERQIMNIARRFEAHSKIKRARAVLKGQSVDSLDRAVVDSKFIGAIKDLHEGVDLFKKFRADVAQERKIREYNQNNK